MLDVIGGRMVSHFVSCLNATQLPLIMAARDAPIRVFGADHRSPESVSADTDRRSDHRVGGGYGDLPFKFMFKTQLMGLIFILLQFIIATDRKVQINLSIHDALPQITTN